MWILTLYVFLVQKKTPVEYSETSFEAKDLKKNGQYEFWVTASTVMGEGPPSNSVMIAPNARGIL